MFRVIKSLVIAGPVAVAFFDNVGYPAVVEGPSMQPTLNPDFEHTRIKDVVFINRFVVRNFQVRRDDIVAMRSPKDPNHRIIKRVIGTEGDVIKTSRYKDAYVDIPEGHFWAESDNGSTLFLDSNVFGPASAGLVFGRATHIIWPPSRWQRLGGNDPLRRAPCARRPMPDILASD